MEVLFETGYGPSGLPHIGTFMEVFRTTLVRHAFQHMSDIPTRMFCISDDMAQMQRAIISRRFSSATRPLCEATQQTRSIQWSAP